MSKTKSTEEVADDIRNKVKDHVTQATQSNDEDEREPRFKIAITVLNPEMLQEGAETEMTQTAPDEEGVKSLLQSLNSYRARGIDIETDIEDMEGNKFEPWDFGMPKPSAYQRRIAKAIGKAMDNPSRDTFETLCEIMASKQWQTWDIIESLDEVFGEWNADTGTMDKAVYDFSDEKVETAMTKDKLSKEEFLEGLSQKVNN